MIRKNRILVWLSLTLGFPSFADSDQITERLRPSELASRREMQVAFTAAPSAVMTMGPVFLLSGKAQLPKGFSFGAEFGQSLENIGLETLMAEVGYSFLRKKGGPALTLLAGFSHRYAMGNNFDNRNGLNWGLKARLGWDLMVGQNFSIGISIAAAYFRDSFLSPASGNETRLPLEMAIPLRIWL